MACPECGASGVDDAVGCEVLFREVIARELGRPELFGVHALTVDAYSLQHPDQYMKSVKSAAAHLAGACWRVEYGGGAGVSRALSQWLDGRRDLPRVEPPPPGRRGRFTIQDVRLVADSEHPTTVRTWAEDVWQAWEVGHELARRWIAPLVGVDGPSRPGRRIDSGADPA